MVSASGKVPLSRRRCRGKATIKGQNGKRGLILFDCIRSGRGPPESKVRRIPTPTTS